jgi:hypothetical protein
MPSSRMAPRSQPATAALRSRPFRRLFFAQTVSGFGDQVLPVAAAVAALDSGGGAAGVGLVLGARFVALVAVALLGGVIADRYSRLKVMISADAFRCAALIMLVVISLNGDVSVSFLAAVVLLVGAGEAVFQPAYTALLPTVVAEDALVSANALTSLTRRTASVVGPGLAGLLVVTVGVEAAFALDAATFALSGGALLMLSEPERPRVANRSVLSESLEGVRVLRAMPWAGAVIIGLAVLLPLTVAPILVLLPVISREEYGGDAIYGLTLSAEAAGGVLGALLAARWMPALPGRVAVLGITSIALLPLALAVTAPVGVLLVCAVITGLALEPFSIWWLASLQREVPPDALARVASLYLTGSLALVPLGMAFSGAVAEVVGRDAVLAAAALVSLGLPFILLRVPGVATFSSRGQAPDTTTA